LWTTLPGNYHFPGKIVWALVLFFRSFLDGPPKKVGYAKLISSACFFCLCAPRHVRVLIYLAGIQERTQDFRLSYIFGLPAWRPPKAKGINSFGKNTGAAEEVGKKFCRPEY